MPRADWAARLSIISSEAVVGILNRGNESWLPLIEGKSRESVTKRELSSWTPVQDIYAMQHHRLTTRLFRS